MGKPEIISKINKRVSTEKAAKISSHVKAILEELGADMTNPNFKETPDRVAKMYLTELYSSLSKDREFPKATVFKGNFDQMLIERNIQVNSACAHHLVPFYGVAHIAYFPRKFVLGLSKFHRIVDYHASKPQVQEELTQDIAQTLKDILKTEDIAIMIDCVHLCTRIRGVKDHASSTRTIYVGGEFRNPSVKQEFLSLIKE
jgi:GTP cyclohydrolase I